MIINISSLKAKNRPLISGRFKNLSLKSPDYLPAGLVPGFVPGVLGAF